MTRRDLVETVTKRARTGAPLLLTGPPGAGKSWLLGRVAGNLGEEGWAVVRLDLMGAASSPERFVQATLAALPAATFGSQLARATEIRRLASAGRAHGAAAVQGVLALLGDLVEAGGQKVGLLLDEATEVRSLCYFEGLRHVDRPFVTALARRPHGTVLASSYTRLARGLWPDLETCPLGPMLASELDDMAWEWGAPITGEQLRRATFGWPRYVRILLDALRPGTSLTEAWTGEMISGGRLEQACRYTYESLLLRSRGYGMAKAVLATVAEEEGLNLTALVGRLGRTPGAVRDYLGWLLAVDALRTDSKRYFYVDGLLRWWVRLHARGVEPTAADLAAAASTLLDGLGGQPPALAVDEAHSPLLTPGAMATDSLMEID